MSVRTKVYTLLGLIAFSGVGVYLYKSKPGWFSAAIPAAKAASSAPQKDKADKEATPVELAEVSRGDISSYISATANLRALREIGVATQVDGIVQKVLAEEGDFVKEGQVLCTFDDTQLRIQLELAKEKLAQAKLQLDKARIRQEKAVAQIGHTQAELTRYQKAHKEGLVSEKEVAAYKYKLEELTHDQRVAASETKELQHRVSELEAEIAQTDLQISRTQIKAPFAGFITQRTVNIGQRVRALESLFNLGAFSPLYADVHLSESDTRTVRPSQEAVIHLGTSESVSVRGRVQRISPIVDQSTGTVKVTVELQPTDAGLPPRCVRACRYSHRYTSEGGADSQACGFRGRRPDLRLRSSS